jgi:hypothetical protein
MITTRRRSGFFMLPAMFIVAMAGTISGQASKPPLSSPSVVAPPTWWRAVPMPDGRLFVTDGGLSVDAALVKPAALPEKLPPASAALLARTLSSPYDKEIGLNDLRRGKLPNTFETPDGVVLNGNYITLLRSILAAGSTRLRTKGKTDPVVIVTEGTAVAVMMPIQPPAER